MKKTALIPHGSTSFPTASAGADPAASATLLEQRVAEQERRIAELERLIKAHFRSVATENTTLKPGKEEYEEAIAALAEGDSGPLERYMLAGGVLS